LRGTQRVDEVQIPIWAALAEKVGICEPIGSPPLGYNYGIFPLVNPMIISL